MKNYVSESNIKSYFENKLLPQIDVTDKVMGKLAGKQNPQKYLRAAAVPIIVTLLLSATVFAGAWLIIGYLELKDSKGKVIAQFEVADSENLTERDKEYSKLYDYLHGHPIGAGKSQAAYMKSSTSPEGICISMSEEERFKSIDTLLKESRNNFNLDNLVAAVPQGYEFADGVLKYTPAKYDEAAFRREAQASGLNIFTKEIGTDKNNLRTASLSFYNLEQPGSFTILVSKAPEGLIYGRLDSSDKPEKVVLNKSEALYRDNHSPGPGLNCLWWYQASDKPDKKTSILLYSWMSKEKIIALAKEIESKYEP